METLEVELRKVGSLRGDLFAEIVIQEEKSHIELVEKAALAGNIWDEWTENETIVDQPRITKPDIQKREAARQKLQQTYESSEWYSVRYQAAVTLGMLSTASSQVIGWIRDLKKIYDSSSVEWSERHQRAEEDLGYFYRNLPDKKIRIAAGEALRYSSLRIWLHELFL